MQTLFSVTLVLFSVFEAAHSLYGFDLIAYDPICAYACARSIGSIALSCSTIDGMTSEGMEGSVITTSPECYAGDMSYLSTLAYCVNASCVPEGVLQSTLNDFWEGPAIANPNSAMTSSEVEASPMWSYAEILYGIATPPTTVVNSEDVLNFTALVNQSTYAVQTDTLTSVYHEEELHTKYGVAILVAGFGLPIVLTLLQFLPYMSTVSAVAKPFLVFPPILDVNSQDSWVRKLGFPPTTGQAIYIAAMTILVVILACINYEPVQPHAWYSSYYTEVLAYSMWRTGLFGFAILPLLILFSSRNNILLWLTNWSYSTFMVLHKWVAWIFGLLVLVHSILALVLYVATGSFSSNEEMAYWIWGVVATLTTVILLVASSAVVRGRSYEAFLITHVVMAVLTIVGCWYHIWYLDFGWSCGDLEWIMAACAVWFFDRLIRVLRVLKAGVRRAQITDIGEGYVRVDINNFRWRFEPGMHFYVFFPMLHPLRPWENHPFSPIQTQILQKPQRVEDERDNALATSTELDAEKQAILDEKTLLPQPYDSTQGLTFIVKKSGGMTQALVPNSSTMALLDGPYPSQSFSSVLGCDRLILLGGGIGITSLLPYTGMHPNAKLFWSLKQTAECLIDTVKETLDTVHEKEILVGERFDVLELIQAEASYGWKKIGIVICGPTGMANDTRAAVAEVGRMSSVRFEMEVDAYEW